MPAPNGGYPRTNIGSTQRDDDLVTSITTAFESAHNTNLRRDRGNAHPIDNFTEQRYRNMVKFLLLFYLFYIF